MKRAPNPLTANLETSAPMSSAQVRCPAFPDFRLPVADVSALTPYEQELREAIGEAYDDIREGRVLTESQMDEVFDELIEDARHRTLQ
ncbi:hypothetical protein [Mitsuaria sp. 7]|uniref:hypothetical protein n=1 Tax=Mitsuaria sp. 7 TaxID=1658665 RepID=UPI0007DD8665|nr:hypothetical protein [Mitsuaria sp. 7]ANH66365.1 hypothetical protein ABE85_00145 [Mitsuaria sp. 7]